MCVCDTVAQHHPAAAPPTSSQHTPTASRKDHSSTTARLSAVCHSSGYEVASSHSTVSPCICRPFSSGCPASVGPVVPRCCFNSGLWWLALVHTGSASLPAFTKPNLQKSGFSYVGDYSFFFFTHLFIINNHNNH